MTIKKYFIHLTAAFAEAAEKKIISAFSAPSAVHNWPELTRCFFYGTHPRFIRSRTPVYPIISTIRVCAFMPARP
ncbi:hypothetical protein BMS3Abin05_01130 [bacterium BMS3Abin05]|nr:hypothetical protein BMS3Abin05_01130 [bacterium BMS3Abin05]